MEKKKKIWVVILVVGAVVCAGGIGIGYVYWSGLTYGTPPYWVPTISFTTNETDSGWNLTVFSMSREGEDIWESQNAIYKLTCLNGSYWRENGTLESIKNSPSGYGVTWFDKDNDNHLSWGDEIFISKVGGSSGTVTPGGGYALEIFVENSNIYLSPRL